MKLYKIAKYFLRKKELKKKKSSFPLFFVFKKIVAETC